MPTRRQRLAAGAAALVVLLLALPSPAVAGIDIDIEGVTREVENNVRTFLSLSRYASRDDVTPQVMARLERRIPVEVRKALEPLGYYEPQVKHTVTGDPKKWQVRIEIAAGRAVRLSEVDISVTGEGKDSAAIAAVLAQRDLRAGRRLDHGVYERVKGDLLRTATNDGYLDAKLTRNELVIDKTERRARAALALETGPRYHFGQIDIEQDVISDEQVRRLLRMREGDPYSMTALLQSQYVLDDTQYFVGVEVEAGDRDHEKLTVPVRVRAEPNRKHRYAISAGYGTDTRARGKLTWDNRLVNSHGHRSTVELTASSVGHEAIARYIIPVMDIAQEKLEFSLSDTREELADAISDRQELFAGLTQAMGSWQRVLFLRFSYETSRYPDRTDEDFLIIPGISFATMPRYLLDQDLRRYQLYSELTGSPSTLGSDASYLRFRFDGERMFDLSERWHLRFKGQLGVSWVADFSELPASQRFFAGGDNSVRGFGLNELSPVDDAGNRVGGRHLLVATVEVERDLPYNFRAAVFADVGNAFDDFSDPLEYSAGVGLRWHLASFASLGLDVAQALSENRSPRLHLHISTVF